MKFTIISVIITIILALLLTSCMQFRSSNKALKKDMKKKNISFEILQDTFQNHVFRYLYMNNTKKENAACIVIVHGAPGSSKDFLGYFEDTSLSNNFEMLIVDRPGYGYSEFGTYMPLDSQAQWINQLIKKHKKEQELFLVGHSFGGPIVARAALLADSMVQGTIMIAPAIDPENEKYFWFGKIGYWKSTKWMISKALQLSATEKYKHAAELDSIKNDWQNLKTPILHIHGTKDGLVPYENLAYSKKTFNPTILETQSWEKQGHLVPFTKKEETIKFIIKFIQKHENLK